MSPTRRHTVVAPGLRALVAVVLSGMTAFGVWALWTTPAEKNGLLQPVMRQLDASGVDSPVTATLLNFRAWDTLLEVTVLVVVLVGIWSHPERPPKREQGEAVRLLEAAHALLVPLMVLTGGYLLWAGTKAPGGAFQAGALLSAAGIFLMLVDEDAPRFAPHLYRFGVVLGVLVFLTVGAASLSAGGNFLEYPTAWNTWLIAAIEAASAISIAACLLGMFAATPQRLIDEDDG